MRVNAPPNAVSLSEYPAELSLAGQPYSVALQKACVCAAYFVRRVTVVLVLCFSARGDSVVSQRVFPYITAIGIGIAAASALSFLSLVLASGIRFGLMH